jgi:hypothetical protein
VAALLLATPVIAIAVLVVLNNGRKESTAPIIGYCCLAFGGMTLGGGAVGTWLSRPIVANPALRMLGAAIAFLATVVSPPFLYVLRRFESHPTDSAWKIALVGATAWVVTSVASAFVAERRM